MTNRLPVIIGFIAGVVIGVVAGVGVDLRLLLWKHDTVDDVKVQRYLVSGDGNLCLHIHVVLWCFSSPGVATPSDGALRWHPHTLTALRTESSVQDVREERGLCVWRGWECSRLGVLLIWSSGREAGVGQTTCSPPGEPARWTYGIPTIISHSYCHASL